MEQELFPNLYPELLQFFLVICFAIWSLKEQFRSMNRIKVFFIQFFLLLALYLLWKILDAATDPKVSYAQIPYAMAYKMGYLFPESLIVFAIAAVFFPRKVEPVANNAKPEKEV